jgi:hypothetical protein
MSVAVVCLIYCSPVDDIDYRLDTALVKKLFSTRLVLNMHALSAESAGQPLVTAGPSTVCQRNLRMLR